MITSIVSLVLGIGVICSQILIVLVLLYFLFLRKKYPSFLTFLAQNGIKLSFVVAAVATLGSLFYSNVAGFMPCELCWFQRIFMYPEVIILGLSLIKKDEKIIDYALSLSVIGWLISVYHNYIYYQSLSSTFCRIGEQCSTPYVTEFGYISIPMMALTGFSLIVIFLLFPRIKMKLKQ